MVELPSLDVLKKHVDRQLEDIYALVVNMEVGGARLMVGPNELRCFFQPH